MYLGTILTNMNKRLEFEILMAMKIQVTVFWVVTMSSKVVGYQCFGGLCCLFKVSWFFITVKTSSPTFDQEAVF